MTIAVTPFDGLCGFRPLKEISHFLASVPSLRSLIGEEAAQEFEEDVSGRETSSRAEDTQRNKKSLQSAFSALMTKDKSTISAAAKDLVASAENDGEKFAGGGGPSNGGKELADLVIRLNGQFEGDVGLFVLFFLNYVKLEVGEAMFLKADDIHAYLSGGSFALYRSSFSINRCFRHHRVHGFIRQRCASRLHAKIPGHTHIDLNADLLIRPNFRAEDESCGLSLRHSEPDRILLIIIHHTVRPAD